MPFPANCPACGAAVRWEDDFLFCGNPAGCRQAAIGRLAHWAATTGILGFGPVLLEKAYDAGLLRSVEDFYALTWEPLADFERCGETMARKLIAEVDARRTLDLATFLRALGLPELGRHVSRLLAERYGTLDAVLSLTAADLAAVHSIGDTIAHAVVSGLAEAAPLIAALRSQLTIVERAPSAAAPTGPLAGKSFVLTGALASLSRGEAEERIRALGGTVTDSVGPALSYLVRGESKRESSKEKAARKRIAEGAELRVVDEAELLELLEAGGGRGLEP